MNKRQITAIILILLFFVGLKTGNATLSGLCVGILVAGGLK
jgi:hypothetical protein